MTIPRDAQATPENRPESVQDKNASPSTPTPTEKSHRPAIPHTTKDTRHVACVHAEGGEVDLCKGATNLASFLELGALLKTRCYSNEAGGKVTATDKAGLECAISAGEELAESLIRGIRTTSKALVYSATEMDENSIIDMAWLICGMAEAAESVLHEVGEARHERERDFGERADD